jgi:hypothetical protein
MVLPPDNHPVLVSLTPLLAFGLTACVATVDATKAPFRATTHLSEATTDAAAVLTHGTTQATKDLTRPIKELLLRMAPGADAGVRNGLKLVAFAIMNHDNVMSDIARGHGEYLSSFALLLGLPPDRHSGFFTELQSRYAWLYADPVTPFQALDRLLGDYYDRNWIQVAAGIPPQ